MSFFIVIQTIIAVIIVFIALWVVFHLLKALVPYKKTVAILLFLFVISLLIYGQGYRLFKDRNDNVQIYSEDQDTFYSIDSIENYNEENLYEEDVDRCSNLPQFCYQMESCSEARQAFECGNYKLDGDSDGVPCENLCGSY